MKKESSPSMIDSNFCAYATRRKQCEKNRSNLCVWKQKRGGNVDEEGMCIDKRVEEFFESIKRCRYNVKKLFKAYDMDGSGKSLTCLSYEYISSLSSLFSPHISLILISIRYILIGGISLEELSVALSSNGRQYFSLQKAFTAANTNEDDELDRLEFRKFAKDTILDGSIFDCDKETTTIFKASEVVVGSMEAIEEFNSGCMTSGKYYVLAASVLVLLVGLV